MAKFGPYLRALGSAGATLAGDETIVVRTIAGTETPMRATPMQRGYVPSKDLVVDSITRIYTYNPTTDRGYNLRSLGIDQNIVQIPNYAQTQITVDATYGEPFFLVSRRSSGMVFVNPYPGVDLGTTANATSRVLLSAAVVGDYVYQTDTGTSWVLTTSGYATPGNWTQLPAGAPGILTIYNDTGLELVENGPEGRYTFIGPNQVVRS